MSHLDLQELLGAYALDAVEPEEVAVIEEHLADCPRCRDELAGHREVAGLFAFAGQEAPVGLWDRITASMQEDPPALRMDRIRPSMVTPPPVVPVPFGPPAAVRATTRRRSVPMRAFVVLAAAAVAAVAFLGVDLATVNHPAAPKAAVGVRSVPARSGAAATMAEVKAALAQPGSRKVVLAALSGPATMDAVITASGRSFIYRSTLIPLGADRTYQLWGFVGSQRVSYGLLGTDPDSVIPFTAGPGVRALAVTDEVSSGVAVSSQPVVVIGSVDPAL